MKRFNIILTTAIFFASCQTQQKTTTGDTDSIQVAVPSTAGGTFLLTGRWNIIAIDKTPVQLAGPYIEFKNDTAIGGKAGCNTYGGHYLLTGNSIRFDRVFSTKMACDADKMRVETQLLNYFNTDGLTIEKKGADELLFKNAAGEVVLEMKREG